MHDFIYEKKIGGIRTWIHRWQKGRAISRSVQIICVSNATRRDLLELHREVDPAQVHVIHHGVEPVFCASDKEPEIHERDPYVLFVGERSGYKNFVAAVHALAGLPQLRLIVVGKPLNDSEQKLVDSVLAQRCVLMSGVSDAKLAQLYREAFALVYPSTYEGFGMPVLEAMACGCPVVARDSSSIPEVAGDAALLVHDDSASSIRAALAQLQRPEQRRRLQELGYRQAERFSWERCVQQHIAVYDLAFLQASGRRKTG